MPATDDTTTDGSHDDQPVSGDQTVTPYAVEGDVDYAKLLEQFGADRITDDQLARFPDTHTLLRREVFYAERDLDPFLEAAADDQRHSIVTGRGPSGPMHLGHVFQFHLARHLQETTGAHVYRRSRPSASGLDPEGEGRQKTYRTK
jgi:tryptophanyl-tRNA synthetase